MKTMYVVEVKYIATGWGFGRMYKTKREAVKYRNLFSETITNRMRIVKYNRERIV